MFINFKRILAVAQKETIEIIRDPMRVVANFAVPVFVMFIFSSGLTLDIKNIPFVSLDYDNSTESRQYIDSYINSDYYRYLGNVYSSQKAESMLKSNKARFYIEIPSNFSRNLLSGNGSQVAIFIDGTQPFMAENINGYVQGTHMVYLKNKAIENYGIDISGNYEIKSRYWYNQAFESKFSFVPGIIVIILMVIPAIMTALSIAKEKETGTISNFYATPLTKLEFLIGKQLIYIIIFIITYFILLLIAVSFYNVPIKGNLLLLTLCAIVYIFSTTAIGLLVSSFVKTQISGLLITLIMTMIPAFTYSGLLSPVSSLPENGRLMARLYPTLYFMNVSVGSFTKNLPTISILPNLAILILFYIIIISASTLLLKKQEI